MISKQQTRLMGFALVFAFAALRAMAAEGTGTTNSTQMNQPLKSQCSDRSIACMQSPSDQDSKQMQQKHRLQKNQRIIGNRTVASAQ